MFDGSDEVLQRFRGVGKEERHGQTQTDRRNIDSAEGGSGWLTGRYERTRLNE